jgi:hypothetical protein
MYHFCVHSTLSAALDFKFRTNSSNFRLMKSFFNSGPKILNFAKDPITNVIRINFMLNCHEHIGYQGAFLAKAKQKTQELFQNKLSLTQEDIYLIQDQVYV